MFPKIDILLTAAFQIWQRLQKQSLLTSLYLRLIPLALLALYLASCDQNGTVVEIDIPDHEERPVLSVDMRAGDTVAYVRVGLSKSILDENRTLQERTGVIILRDGEPILDEELSVTSTSGITQEIELPGRLSAEPADYEARLDFPGFDPVVAFQRMPAAPVVRNATLTSGGAFFFDGYEVDEVTVELTDHPDARNFYGVRVTSIRYDVDCQFVGQEVVCDTVGTRPGYELWAESSDPGLRYSEGYGLVFTDETFNGTTKNIRLAVDNYNNDSVQLEVLHLTEDAYRYGLTRWAAEEAGFNPFAEPINVHENVDGGYGQFLVVNRVIVTLE